MNFSLPDAIDAAGGDTKVAAAIGKSAYTVAQWRRGERVPSPDDQEPLAAFLRAPLPDLAAWCARKATAIRSGA